ncbi:MAG: hypothetical protein WBP72_04465 [Rhodocyclaceae bacterium]
MKLSRVFAIFFAVVLLAACAQMFPGGSVARSDKSNGGGAVNPLSREEWQAEAEEVQSFLAYYQRMLGTSAEDLRKEFAAVNLIFNRDKSDLTRMKLALLMSLPGGPFRDDSRLTSLLDGAASKAFPPDSPRHQFLVLLSRLTSERLRQVGAAEREGARKLETQLRDEQRRAEDEQKRAEELQKRADEAQKRADEVQQKLDKLLAIEREMRRAPRRLPQ